MKAIEENNPSGLNKSVVGCLFRGLRNSPRIKLRDLLIDGDRQLLPSCARPNREEAFAFPRPGSRS